MRTRAVISCVYLGFFSQVAQVVLLREALTTFAGVEIVLGLALGVWLIAAGAGSIAAHRVNILQARPLPSLQALYLAAGVLFPLTIFAVRLLPTMLAFAPGEIVAPEVALAGTALSLGPLCLLLGALFVANVRVFGTNQTEWSGKVYLFEACGAAAGGLVVTFLFIPFLSHLMIALVLLASGAMTAAVISGGKSIRLVLGAVAVLIIGAAPLMEPLDLWTRTRHRTIGEFLALADSPYGQIAVTRYGEQYSLLVNGTLAASFPDRQSAEEAVHFALLSHRAPKTALLIGGGVGGAVSEALKHHVQLDYVELDPQVVRLARQHFPLAAIAPLDSCRIIYEDGRAYMSRTAKTYDVIMLNLGEPSSALINRFFTREFFEVVKAHLADSGVFSFRVPSSESYLSSERERFLSSLNKTLSAVFPEEVVLPGPSAVFIATAQTGMLIRSANQFATRINGRNLHTEFVNAYLLPNRLSDAAFEFLAQHLQHPQAKMNTDLRPMCYLYDAILWNLHFTGPHQWVMSRLAGVPAGSLAGMLGVLAIALVGVTALRKQSPSLPTLVALFVTGLTGVAIQVVLMFSFQAVLGYVYAKIGLLASAFMVGMSIGSYLLTRRAAYGMRTLALLLLLPLAVALVLLAFLVETTGAIRRPIPAEFLFYLFSLVLGFCGGALFVPANRLYLATRHSAGTLPVGTGYAMDLAGSALGALAVSSILIPIWGIPFTILLVAECNLAALLLVVGPSWRAALHR